MHNFFFIFFFHPEPALHYNQPQQAKNFLEVNHFFTSFAYCAVETPSLVLVYVRKPIPLLYKETETLSYELISWKTRRAHVNMTWDYSPRISCASQNTPENTSQRVILDM